MDSAIFRRSSYGRRVGGAIKDLIQSLSLRSVTSKRSSVGGKRRSQRRHTKRRGSRRAHRSRRRAHRSRRAHRK